MLKDFIKSKKWKDLNLVAFDLETTGKYPLSSEICEIAAVKYQDGKVVDEFQTLILPKRPMSSEVIAIHGITNEMVIGAPPIEAKVSEFSNFVEDSIMMAHHSPFDMGFLAWEFERAQINFPEHPAMCTSLLSRALIKESPNHKLVTLAKTLGIDPGSSHRALDDARTCLKVGLECLNRLGANATMEDVFKAQGQNLMWSDFSVKVLSENRVNEVVMKAMLEHSAISMAYQGGSRPGKERIVYPTGLVRGPERDFIMALDPKENIEKRYYLNRITSASIV